jgi:predicted amidohydrolase
VLASLPEGPGVVVADVDPARIAGVRASLPALRHRKISNCLHEPKAHEQESSPNP